MENLSLPGDLSPKFRESFPECELSYKPADLSGKTVHCFFATIPSEEMLALRWVAISNFLALHFQSKITSDFEKWNLYLFFKLASPVQKELHYEIENDTFSSRKIVLASTASHDDVIKEYILYSDLREDDSNTTASEDFVFNPLIYNEIVGIKSKKKLSMEIEASLTQIIQKIRTSHETQES